MNRVHLEIDGMSCGHCVGAVRKALGNLDGVTPESVSIGHADVSFDPSRVDATAIVASVKRTGYEARIASTGVR